jgi:iron(III) transport system permease protein
MSTLVGQRTVRGGHAPARRGRPWGRNPASGRASISGYATSTVLILVLLGLVGLPAIFVIIAAVAKDPINLGAGFSLDTLKAVYTDSGVLTSLWETVVISVVVGVAATAVGGILAWMFTRIDLPGSGFLESLAVIPMFLSPLVGTIAWQGMLAPRSGIINNLLTDAGAPSWLHPNIDSLWGIIVVLAVNYVPYGYMFTSGVLRNVDAGLEEASHMSGAGLLRTVRKVLVPILRPALLSSVLFISILAAGEFSVPSILGASTSYEPLSVEVYQAVNGYPQDYPTAGAISTMMIVISLVAMLFYRRSVRNSSRFVTVRGRSTGGRRPVPPWLKASVLTGFGLYVLVTVVLPYASLILIVLTKYRTGDVSDMHFTTANITTVLNAPDVRQSLVNTVIVSLVVPVACIVVGLIVVYCSDRLRVPGGTAANLIATAPLAISGIVFGTGVLIAYIRTPLYATIWLIAVALVAHYVAHAVRIVGNGFTQIDASLEEAARMSGASRARVLFTIGAPLLRPSLASAFLLIYVFTIREVNTSIMLYSPTSQVLAVLAWNYLSDGSLAQAAVVGVIQTLLMVIGLVIARFVLGVSTSRSALS